MKCKITSYRKTLFIGWLCLLMFAMNQTAHAKLKIYYMPIGRWERNLWRMDIDGNKQGTGPRIARSDVLAYTLSRWEANPVHTASLS